MSPSAPDVPTLRLNDGHDLPAIGFGTAGLKGDEGITAITSALENGYRLLDTAVNYGNEREVGEAIRRSGVPREELRITTKIPGRDHAFDAARTSIRTSLETLGVDYIDLHLIHWPNPSQDLYPQAFQALVDAQSEGLVRSVGVSNFTSEHLDRVIGETGVTPAVNQIELHPMFPQDDMRQVDSTRGVVTESWSPMGERQVLLAEDAIEAAATAHGVSPGRVILRWHVQLGALPIPLSRDPGRQRDNLDVFGFELTDAEMAAIAALARPDARLFDADPDTHEEM